MARQTMTDQINQPTVLVSSGDPLLGPYYLVISGLPEYTKWQDLADFLRCKVCPRLDVYVSLNGPKNTSGWIRVIGMEIFTQVERVIRENQFKGQQIIYHDPGFNYTHGFGAILINGPFVKDQHLFLPMEILSSVPSQSPTMSAVGDTIWVWPQGTPIIPTPPSSTTLQYPVTPISPQQQPLLPPVPWDGTQPRYAQVMPQQIPHFQQQQHPHYPYHQQQNQPQPLPTTFPWYPQPTETDYPNFQAHPQIYVQPPGASQKLIMTWKEPSSHEYHAPATPPSMPVTMYPTMPWIQRGSIDSSCSSPITSTTSTTYRQSRDRQTKPNKKLCTTIRAALSVTSAQKDPWIKCSPDTAIATFRTPQHALQAFYELSHSDTMISVRFPYSNEDLRYLEEAPVMRPCTHLHHKWQPHDQQQQKIYYDQYDQYQYDPYHHHHHQYTQPRDDSQIIITTPSPRRRRRAIKPLPPMPHQQQPIPKYMTPPPSLPPQHPKTTAATATMIENNTDNPQPKKQHVLGERGGGGGNSAVLIVDGSSRRHDVPGSPLPMGVAHQTQRISEARGSATSTSTSKPSVLVVNGSVNSIGHVAG